MDGVEIFVCITTHNLFRSKSKARVLEMWKTFFEHFDGVLEGIWGGLANMSYLRVQRRFRDWCEIKSNAIQTLRRIVGWEIIEVAELRHGCCSIGC